MVSTLEIFFSYSHKDEALRDELEKQLNLLKRQGFIAGWHDRRIIAGQEWVDEIDAHLKTARIIFLLISPDFMASDYCYDREMRMAMERYEAGEAHVIPIILRPVDWHGAPFGKLQALPKNGEPVTRWTNHDEAFLDIARSVRKIIEELNMQHSVLPKYVNRNLLPLHANNVQSRHILQSPYRGLFAFREEDEPYFFGREIFTQRLVDEVHRKPFVTVIGSSGSGKSSLVFAGLVPRLRNEGNWLITSLRPGKRPFRSLAVALMPLLEPTLSERARLIESNELAQQLHQGKLTFQDIVELIMQKHVGKRLLFVIDQFEEIYTLCREQETVEDFLNKLISTQQAISEHDLSGLSLVLTLRADFVGQALTYEPFADALQSASFMLGPMNMQQLKDAISRPAQILQVMIEDRLTERIAHEVKQGTNRLPLLEFALALLWEKQKDNKLTHTAYEEIGGVEKALADHAEKVFEALSEPERVRAQRVFVQLVSFGEGTDDTRRIATRTDIGEDNWELVVRLSSASARLVVSGRDETSGEDTVEVIHEALIRSWQRLRGWMEDNREFRTWQERLRFTLRQWEKSNKADEALLYGASLVEATKWKVQRPEAISLQEKIFIDISQQHQEKEAQRWKDLYEDAQRFALLYQTERELSEIADPVQLEQAYDFIVKVAESQSQSQVVVYLYDETNAELVLKCASFSFQSLLSERIKIDEGPSGQVAQERKIVVVHDISKVFTDNVAVELSDPKMHSFIIAPISFKNSYYGNLEIRHEDVGHFRNTDINFIETLAQQLASTIYRLETITIRQKLTDEMSAFARSAFELTHRLGNDLGLVNYYIHDIQVKMEKLGLIDASISKTLENIKRSVGAVLTFSGNLQQELLKSSNEEIIDEPVLFSPRELLEEVCRASFLPPAVQIYLEFDTDVAQVRAIRDSVADILRSLITNAFQAMPDGGTLTLKARNVGRHVALEVTDTGYGIHQQKLSMIFDLFFSTKGSSGFGLWSARRNAIKNHGDLKVYSQPGQGSIFTLLLPRADE